MKKNMLLCAALGVALSVSTSAEISKTLDYQGRLMDASGKAVADGSYTITVSLWNDSSSTVVTGHRLWTNPYNATTKNGYFHLILGDGTNSPLLTSVNFDQSIYAETQISGDPNPLPRQLLNASAYAMTVADGAIGNSKVANGVSAAKISLSNGEPLSAWESSTSAGKINGTMVQGTVLPGVHGSEHVPGGSDPIPGPVGAVMMYAGTTPPTGWLLCDGSPVSRTTYAALYAVITNIYGSDVGGNFTLPDFRGVFPKGAGTTGRAAGVDANGTPYAGTLGAYVQDRFQGHYHNLYNTTNNWYNALEPWSGGSGSGGIGAALEVRQPITDGGNGTPRTGTTTEPQSLGINYIIKY